MTKKPKKTKPGPGPERLVIEGDPEEALARLLRSRSKAEDQVDRAKTFKCPFCDMEAPLAACGESPLGS